jgi:hypothetical protein
MNILPVPPLPKPLYNIKLVYQDKKEPAPRQEEKKRGKSPRGVIIHLQHQDANMILDTRSNK